MTEYDQRVTIEGESFMQMRADANVVLQKLLKNMVEKETNEGSLTIKVDVNLVPEWVPIPIEKRIIGGPESRMVLRPRFEHKISSTMQIKDNANGEYTSELMELVFDEFTGQYILTPVKDGEQMTIYDLMEQGEKHEDPEKAQEGDRGLYGTMNEPVYEGDGFNDYEYQEPEENL